ncbi:hydantoinase B/oxoprolinase family protein [Pseudonocardiaceae bacterium YIM PH 21723]|nr:hydantoinase B/oxoprolinase family protein [Pseudonocardiaceae bacterium YIM PH 21723]
MAIAMIRTAVTGAAEQMALVLRRGAFSSAIHHAGEYAVALLDREHGVVSACLGAPTELGALRGPTRQTEAQLGAAVWQPGDVWLLCDEVLPGAYASVNCFTPVFTEGELIGFAVARANWPDPASPGLAQLGPVLIVHKGQQRAGVLDALLRDLPARHRLHGDLGAALAALRVGAARYTEVAERWGIGTLAEVRDLLAVQTRRRERDRLASLPDGVYRAEGSLDGLGGQRDLTIGIVLRITGADLTIDLTDCPDQTGHGLNCAAGQVIATCQATVNEVLHGGAPIGGGSFRALRVQLRTGSMLDATGTTYTWHEMARQLVSDLICRALAPVAPHLVRAGGGRHSLVISGEGVDPRTGGRWYGAQRIAAGTGARRDADGRDAVQEQGLYLPVEILEHAYPVRLRRFAIRAGSGGAGARRGGHGVLREYEFTGDAVISVHIERTVEPAWGLCGGEPGLPAEVILNPGTAAEYRPASGESFPVRAGDVLLCLGAGGGGFGMAPVDSPGAQPRGDHPPSRPGPG